MSDILTHRARQLNSSLAPVNEVMKSTEHTDTQDVDPIKNENDLIDVERIKLAIWPSPDRESYRAEIPCEWMLQLSNGNTSMASSEGIREKLAKVRPISSSLSFATAGLAKAIKVTDESMAKAAALLSDGNGQSDVRSGIGTSTSGWKQRPAKSELDGGVEPANNRVTPPISSFTTAGLGKAITVSKESLSKAAHVLGGETLPPTFRLSFATAGLRKTITVSDESLHRAAELFIDRSRSEIVGAAGRGCANAELTSTSNNMTDCEEAAKYRCNEVRCEAVADTSNAGLARMTAFAFVDSNKSDGKLGMTGTASLAPAFTTAGRGKTTSVSKESMATAALLLGGGNDIGQFDAHATTMPSFTTVERCKNSLTSDESMTKVTKLLSDISSKDGHSSETFMPTFMTAGLGKPISVSDENMAEAAQLLSAGIDKDSLSSATTLPIFMTAGLGKTISASDESMAKAERLLSAVVGMDSPSSALTLPTFKTAGLGKSISVPDENMAEAVQLPFFTTAGLGKTISASDESMAKATKLLSAVSCKGTPLHAHATTMPAFTTAGLGKTISASDESMAKATKLLSAVSCKGTPLHAHATRMPAFTTAGLGKTISASAESMAKAAQLLAGTGSIDGHVYNNATLEPVSMSPRKKSMAMASWVQANNSEHVQEVATYAQAGSPIFATAGLGKRISVSHESIKKADQLFGGTEQCNGKSSWITAFATAGAGKAIQVSKNSMAKAQQLFEGDGNDTCLDKPFGTNMPADTIMGSGQLGTVECTTPAAGHHDIRCGAGDCPMFATAGLGKAISVSNESLDKATKLLTTERSASVECQKASMRRSDECDMIRKERETYGNSCTVLTSPARKYGPPSNDMCSANARSKPIPRVSLGEGYFEQHPGDQQASSPALPSRTRVSFETADLASRRRYDGQYVIREFEKHARDKTSFIDALRQGNFSDSSLAEQDGLHSCILIINSRNATNLRFDLETGFPAGFLASLSHHLRPLLGDTASYRNALLKLGCDCLMLTDNWIQNHVRWIIWKLASKERRFSRWLGGSYLTFSRVVEQLHHRFKKEIASGSRPVVRRILNRDVTAGCLMILCVADIRLHIEGSQESYLFELTDGWYPVRCWPADMHLVRLVGEGRIRVGSKLLLSSACLVGGENGVDPSDDDFDPFSATSPTLRISVNATRLARWNAKLGQISALSSHFSGCRNGMLHILKLSDVLEGGGSLPSIDLFVVKKFPLKYLLLHPEDPEGPSNLITEAEEAQRRMEYEKRRQVILDKFIDEIQQECEKDVDDKAPEIWHQYVSHDSPEEFYNGLPREQQREIEHWRDKRSTLLQKLVQGEATAKLEEHDLVFVPSKPFIRILVRSVISDSGDGSNEEAVLTIWDPCEEQLNVIKEGGKITVVNVGVKAERFDGKLQLSASSRTSIVELSSSNSRPTRPRAVTEQSVTSIFRAQVISKSCPETTSVVDVTGIVINSNIPKQKVAASLYLTDQSGLLMRVECDTSGLVRQIASASNGHENEPSVCLQLHAVTLQSYDHIEGCAVVQFGNKSTVIQGTQSAFAKELDHWSKSKEGRSRLDQQATRLKAGIWRHACEESCNKTAIGYITGFHFCGSTQDLLIYVDCGGNVMHVWKLHLSCLVDNESLWNLNGSVALDPATERNLAGLHRIAGFLRSRHKPYLFHLQRLEEPIDVPDCHYEVLRIDALCTEALAEVYSRTLRSSLVLKE
ncbi:hypothetical protein MPSEU_000456000 [Mayamaea pseudoterrestris]|nr:hypothetical protein MPSEU_000456000 [Mayamaea pseudoterrestris]